MNLKNLLFAFVLLFIGQTAYGQYWYGLKAGIHRTSFNYQNEETIFDIGGRELVQNRLYRPVEADYNYEFGAMLSYTASDRYAVHGELLFEKVSKEVTSQDGAYFIDNSFNYSYLSVPLFLRVMTGSEPVHYYFNLGPKISYLLRANGTLFIDDFNEVSQGPRDVQIVFNQSDAGEISKVVLDRPNRLQYSLNLGVGMLLDLRTGGRMMIDLRYSWGHSHLGSNTDSSLLGFGENAEYTNQILSFSIGYMISYNPSELLKGTSTNKLMQLETEKKEKKKKTKN